MLVAADEHGETFYRGRVVSVEPTPSPGIVTIQCTDPTVDMGSERLLLNSPRIWHGTEDPAAWEVGMYGALDY